MQLARDRERGKVCMFASREPVTLGHLHEAFDHNRQRKGYSPCSSPGYAEGPSQETRAFLPARISHGVMVWGLAM